jgi:formamidopyrimidine-DNA glycosylase
VGLERWVVGRTVSEVAVTHPRSVRRHVAGAADLAARLVGGRFTAACRRGKYLWLPLTGPGAEAPDQCLVGHLGMSGQLLVEPIDAPIEKHLHVRIRFADGGRELRFVDQRTFGGLLVDQLVPTTDRADELLPHCITHIARDPLDRAFDDARFTALLRRKNSGIKRVLLDQSAVSGVGNIYADESLWRARLHGDRVAATLSRPAVRLLLASVREVLRSAVRAGGTSFDALYVNVNGQSGWFERSLEVYGREGQPCSRCGTAIRRTAFANRSSFFCPRCQPVPRRLARAAPVAVRSGAAL